MKDKIKCILFSLLRYIFCGKVPDTSSFNDLTEEELKVLYKVSKKHDIAHLVGKALKDNNLLKADAEISKCFTKEILLAVYRYEKQKYEYIRVSELLEASGIEYIPLKGTVIRDYYPEPWMRTSSDIDILIKKDELNKALDILKDKLKYKHETTKSHDAQLWSPDGIHLELHYDLLEEGRLESVSNLLAYAWKHAKTVDGRSFEMCFDNEFFYLYHVVHMAKHIEGGGCGIRPFVDLLIMQDKMDFNKDVFRKLCRDYGMQKFYDACCNLVDVWFRNKEHDETTKIMEEYVLFGGLYGHAHSKTAVKQIRLGGRFNFYLSKIWKPYDELKYMYPSLNGKRWLTLFYQFRRWGRLVFCGGAKQDIKNLGLDNRSSKQIHDIAYMMKKLGL